MTKQQKALQKLLRAYDAAGLRLLAKRAGTSVATIRHIAAGRRRMTAEMAARLERASVGVPTLGNGYMDRSDICKTCANCPYVGRAE